VGAGVLVGHPQDHLLGPVLAGPPDRQVDERPGHPPAAVARVHPDGDQVGPSGRVGLGEDPGQADVGATLAGDEGRGRGVVAGPLPPDLVGQGSFRLQGAGEGAGRVGQRPQP
jgi:hypothetical protein